METKNKFKYLLVDNQKLKLNLNTLIKQLKNIYEENECYYFYGGGRIPLQNEDGSEIECLDNVKLINAYIPIMKKCIKGHSNWSNMNKSEKKVGNHLRFFIKVLTDDAIPHKTMRYPKFKSYMVKRYNIHKNILF
mgnify:CR=1 FL=1